jgi:uncharacterized phage infection (PIP) family protein YhgE
MDFDKFVVSSYYKILILLVAQSLLILVFSQLYINRLRVLTAIKEKFNIYLVSGFIGIVVITYQSQLIDLLKSPPSWIFLVPLVLYYLTILSSTYKERVDQFKDKVGDIQKVAEEQKSSVNTLTTLSDTFAKKFKSLSIKLQGVNKVSKTLQETASDLKAKVDSLDGKYDSLDGKYDSLNSKYDSLDVKYDSLIADFGLLQTQVTDLSKQVSQLNTGFDGLILDVNGLTTDVGGLKEDFGGLKEDVGGLKEDVGGLSCRFEDMFSLLQQIANRP